MNEKIGKKVYDVEVVAGDIQIGFAFTDTEKMLNFIITAIESCDYDKAHCVVRFGADLTGNANYVIGGK